MKITKGLLALSLTLTLASSVHADWKLPIKVESGGVTVNAGIGMEAGASNGYDPGRDVPVPDDADTLVAGFSHPEWGVTVAGTSLSDFYQEIKGEEYPAEWSMEIDTTITSSHTITWVKPDVLPKGLTLYLYPPSGDKIDMLTTKSYAFTPSSSNEFTIQASLEGTTPPLAPTITKITPQDSSLFVEWAGSDPDVAGYKIHFGTSSGRYEMIDVKYVTNLTIKKLTNGTTYYVAVTAYNKNGFESSYSAEQQGVPAEVIRYYAISGKVKDYKGNGVSGVTVTISATPSIQTTTDANGNYIFSGLASGAYKVAPSKGKKDKFNPGRKTVSITSKDATGVDFTLKKEKK